MSRATSAINGRVMIQYERSGVPSRISRWPTAISLPSIVLLFPSANCDGRNSAILSNLTGLPAKLLLPDDFPIVGVSLTLQLQIREYANGL